MKTILKKILLAMYLGLTALLLIGHGFGGGGASPPDCWWDGKNVELQYNSVGSCGEVEVVTFSRGSHQCKVKVDEGASGLPEAGTIDDSVQAGFWLTGVLNRDYELHCTGTPVEGSDDMRVTCGADTIEDNYYISATPWCETMLRPVTDDCDVLECETPDCAPEEHLAYGDGKDCCPVCVPDDQSSDTDSGDDTDDTGDEPFAKPGELPEVCHKDECIDSCPDGEELMYTDACCPECAAQPADCLDGRLEMWAFVADARRDRLACETDADCTIWSVGSACGVGCPAVWGVAEMQVFYEEAQAEGELLCGACFYSAHRQADCASVDGRPICVDNTCVLGPY
jgi:hypothetical protein